MELTQADIAFTINSLLPQVTVSTDSLTVRDELLAGLKKLTQVTNAEEQRIVVAACTEATRILKEVETARAALKKPITTLGKKVDAAASEFCDPVENDVKRAMAYVAAFQVQECRRVEDERLAAEKRIRDAHEAEAAAIAAKLALAQAPPDDEEAAIFSQMQAQQAVAQATEAAQAVIAAPEPEVARVSGMSVRRSWNYTVTDAAKVYAAHPEFFELKEKRAAIKAVIGEGFKCDGMEVYEDTRVGIRL